MRVSYVNKNTQEQRTFDCVKVDVDLDTKQLYIHTTINCHFVKPLQELDGNIIIRRTKHESI